MHPLVKGIHRAPPFSKGRSLRNIYENTLTNYKYLLQNHWANSNQTWHRSSFGKGDLRLLKWRARLISRGNNYKIAKLHWRTWKNHLLQNHWANLNQTWLKSSLDIRNLFNWRSPFFFQGEIIAKLRKYIDIFKKSSPERLGQCQPNLTQSILGWRGFEFVQMKGPFLSKRR